MSSKIIYSKSKYKTNKTNKRVKINNKIRLILFIFVFILFTTSFINIKYSNHKCKDLDYAIRKYTTSGIFNKYKLYSLDNYVVKFSDNAYAIVEVTGLENKSPYKSIKYTLHLKKNIKGTWKVQEYYPRS